VVEGISELSEGVLLGERYLLVRRLDLFSVGAERVAGVEYEYWSAVDVASETEVWIQFAAADGVYAGGAELAGAVSALRRINHPAVPVVPAFGEYEFEREGEVAAVGYCAVPAVAGETLAAALLRAELDRAEIVAALGQVAEVLELLAEFELVHGHLSAHSVLLSATEGAGYEVVLADLPASLALETAVESELTVAADVYALAWLTVLAMAGPAVLEAEFGFGFAVTTETGLELLAEEVVGRRLAWAAENLVALGVSSELTEVLLLALGESGGRPRASVLTGALRAEWLRYAQNTAEAADVVVAEEAVADVIVAEEAVAGAAAVVGAAAVAGVAVAGVAAAEAAESVTVTEVAETTEVVEVEAAESGQAPQQQKPGKKKRPKAAAAAGTAAVVGAVEVLAAESASAAVGTTAASATGAVAAGSAAAGSAAAGSGSAAAVTEIIPKVRPGTRPAQGAASPSGPIGGGAGRANAASARGAAEHGKPRRPHPGVLVGAGVGLVIVTALIITFTSGTSKSANAASAGSVSTSSASASASSTAGTVASSSAGSGGASAASSASAGGGSGSGASASASSAGGASAPTATSTAGDTTFPATLETVPASAGEAVTEIQAAVGQAQGELSGSEQGQLSQIISTLNQEISSGQSLSTGIAQLWSLLHSGELPASLNTYLIQLATYLSASQGS